MIIEAYYIEQYKIHVMFNDHKKGIVDLKDVILRDHRPIFKEITDLDKFKHFRVKDDTIVWENGLDLAPEFLYELCQSDRILH